MFMMIESNCLDLIFFLVVGWGVVVYVENGDGFCFVCVIIKLVVFLYVEKIL